MRILALTRNASLLVALGSMMRDWEVVSANDVESASQLEPGAAVALIDLGPTEDGLSAATELNRHGVMIPCVVLGDEPAEDPRAFVLVRPFSLEDLATVVGDAVTRPPVAASAPIASPVDRAQAPAAPALPTVESNGGSTEVARAEPAPSPREEPQEEPQPASGNVRPFTVVRSSAPAPMVEQESEPVEREPEPILQAHEPPEEEPEPLDEPEPQPIRDAQLEPVLEKPEPEPVFDAEPEPFSEPRVEPEPEVEREPYIAARVESVTPPPSQVVWDPPPTARPQAAPPQRHSMAASSAATAPDTVESASQTAGRWRLRRKPPARPVAEMIDTSEAPLVRQLRQAARNAAHLEMLIDELPFLADLASMADGLVEEVDSQFSAQVASVFVHKQDGYHVVAYRGLSKVESGMVVPDNQPLFSDVLQTREGIMIQPVDLAQGLVAGIGGARTEAIMAVPAVIDGECVAIVIVGRDHFSETDLDRLTDLANEAAPGLAVAQALARLRERI